MIDKINCFSKSITDKLCISDHVSKLQAKEAYILLKGHKPDFRTNPSIRLINPTRPEIGRISKTILEKINQLIKSILGLLQWVNTADVINWFTGIKNKDNCTFMQFDIIDYYPSISKDLFTLALEFAQEYSNISDNEMDIILKCRNSVLVCNEEQSTKKTSSDNLDISIGSLYSTEASDLVGLFLLYNLSAFEYLDSDSIGLYRDDGLLIVKDSTKIKVDCIRKMIHREFKDLGLKTIVTANIKPVDFLDVTLDLNNRSFQPYIKVNSYPAYVHPSFPPFCYLAHTILHGI